jgi:hypothetical protein
MAYKYAIGRPFMYPETRLNSVKTSSTCALEFRARSTVLPLLGSCAREDFHTSNRTSNSPLTALVIIEGGACFGSRWLIAKCSQDTIAAHRFVTRSIAPPGRPLCFAGMFAMPT